MELTVAQLAAGVHSAADAMIGLEQELNAADAKLGDGDTGSMLARVIGAMAAAEPERALSISDAFARLARAGMSATGSSLGTLFAGALLSLSKQTKDNPSVQWSDLGELLETARAGMQARGGASPGDKTVLDALDAVARAIAGKADSESIGPAAVKAAEQVLNAFRDLPCRVGRAKFFADRSSGLDDPGMLAVSLLAKAMVAPRAKGS